VSEPTPATPPTPPTLILPASAIEAAGPASLTAEPAGRRGKLLRRGALVAGLLAFLGLAFWLDDVTNPLLLGLLLAYVLNPIVEACERRGLSRERSVIVLFGLVLLGLIGLAIGVGVKAADGLDDLRRVIAGEPLLDPRDPDDARRIAEVPTLVRPADAGHVFIDEDRDFARRVGLAEKATALVSEKLGARLSRADLVQLARAYQAQVASVLLAGVQASQGLRRSFSQIGTFFAYVLLVPLYTFFLLQSFSRIREHIRAHLPGAYRARIVDIARKVDRQVAAFFRGRLILAVIKGAVTWLGLLLAGVPFSFFLGLMAGGLSFVPFVGPLFAGSLAVVLSFEGPDGGVGKLVWVALALGAAEVVEAVAQPVIVGREVGLSPVALILSLVVFGHLFGFFGVLLAVPCACITKILFAEFVLPEVRALAAEPGPPVDPPETTPAQRSEPPGPLPPAPALVAPAAPAAPPAPVATPPPIA
jgi:predicted PurR-regulated permease PerM